MEKRTNSSTGGGRAGRGGFPASAARSGGSGTKRSRTTAKSRRNLLDLAALTNNDDDDEIVSSSSGEDDDDETPDVLAEEEEGEEENLEAKKVRLAREYLEKIDKKDDDDESETSSSSSEDGSDRDDDQQHDAIARKLQRERMKRQGTWERDYADKLQTSIYGMQREIVEKATREGPSMISATAETNARAWMEAGYVQLLPGGHDLTPTCVALQASGEKAVSGSKDHSVIVWDMEKQQRIGYLCPHWRKDKEQHHSNSSRTKGQVLSVACSDDGRYAVVGKRDATVSIYDIRSNGSLSSQNLVKTFEGHKGAITSLAFRTQSLQLFSASDDRCIRHYNLDEMMYLETLYGHQFAVTGIDCHRKERPISTGRDRTARAWKLAEDSHLIFRGGAKVPPADTVAVFKDDWFVTGHEDGVVSLWTTDKKRAVASVENAHGVVPGNGLGRPIVTMNSIKGSDIVATGSHDGYLRLWKVRTGRSSNERGLAAAGQIPLHGFVNGLAFGPRAKFCVAAVGQEHRCGRWERVPRAKNRLAIIKLQISNNDDDDDDILK